MVNFFLCFTLSIVSFVASAQEAVKYRITYDCDSQYYTGHSQTFRWTLAIGDSTAVFYNTSEREYRKEMAKVDKSGDYLVTLEQIRSNSKKFPNRQQLQILLGQPERGKYTYVDDVLATPLMYEENIPQTEWQLSDSTMTISGYECKQATGTVYGRAWTVWYADELPMSYGPYILGGLPGLILKATDADGLFKFNLSGIEAATDGEKVAMSLEKKPQKCTRKHFLKMRSEEDGLTEKERIERALNNDSPSKKRTIYTIKDSNGKDISNQIRPRKNFFEKE